MNFEPVARTVASLVGNRPALSIAGMVAMLPQLTTQAPATIEHLCVLIHANCAFATPLMQHETIEWLAAANCGLVALLIGFILVCFSAWFYVDEETREAIARKNTASRVVSFHVLAVAYVFVAFALSVNGLVASGAHPFTDPSPSREQIYAFCGDLALKGMLVDVMEHFKLTITKLEIDRSNRFFVWYSFVFRFYFNFIGIKVAISGVRTVFALLHKGGIGALLPRPDFRTGRGLSQIAGISGALMLYLYRRFVDHDFPLTLIAELLR